MSKFYHGIIVLWVCICDIFKAWKLIYFHGQKREYEIIQTAHRLEKGLTYEHPKEKWGWEKAVRLSKCLSKVSKSSFASITGSSVLAAYLRNKIETGDKEEKQKAEKMLERGCYAINQERGGVFEVSKEGVLLNEAEIETCERMFKTRHSARDFADGLVSSEVIAKAVKLALLSPSACNRQPTHVYVSEIGGAQSIYLTGDIRAFGVTEFYDWMVSTSIFAGYLQLALHLYGIGSCIIRKQLYGNKLKEIYRRLNIPQEEKIIIELKIGYYKESFRAAVSNRMNADDIIRYEKV